MSFRARWRRLLGQRLRPGREHCSDNEGSERHADDTDPPQRLDWTGRYGERQGAATDMPQCDRPTNEGRKPGSDLPHHVSAADAVWLGALCFALSPTGLRGFREFQSHLLTAHAGSPSTGLRAGGESDRISTFVSVGRVDHVRSLSDGEGRAPPFLVTGRAIVRSSHAERRPLFRRKQVITRS